MAEIIQYHLSKAFPFNLNSKEPATQPDAEDDLEDEDESVAGSDDGFTSTRFSMRRKITKLGRREKHAAKRAKRKKVEKEATGLRRSSR